MPTNLLPCDGCGHPATDEHIARRLQRLEWTTRYRPVHIGTLLLGAVSPASDADFLYAGRFGGEAGRLLRTLQIEPAGRNGEAVLTEFQRGGFFLAHVLECPLEQSDGGDSARDAMLARRAQAVAARIRRSLKPRRVVLIAPEMQSLLDRFSSSELGCPVLLDSGQPFDLSASLGPEVHVTLRTALGLPVVVK